LFLFSGTIWTVHLLTVSHFGKNLCGGANDSALLNTTASTNGTRAFHNVSTLLNGGEQHIFTSGENIDAPNPDDVLSAFNVTSVKTVDDINNSQNSTCVKCTPLLVYFSLAVVVTDWTMVIFGSLYLVSFSCHKFTKFKDHLLLLNA